VVRLLAIHCGYLWCWSPAATSGLFLWRFERGDDTRVLQQRVELQVIGARWISAVADDDGALM